MFKIHGSANRGYHLLAACSLLSAISFWTATKACAAPPAVPVTPPPIVSAERVSTNISEVTTLDALHKQARSKARPTCVLYCYPSRHTSQLQLAILKELAPKYRGHMDFIWVNLETHPELVEENTSELVDQSRYYPCFWITLPRAGKDMEQLTTFWCNPIYGGFVDKGTLDLSLGAALGIERCYGGPTFDPPKQ